MLEILDRPRNVRAVVSTLDPHACLQYKLRTYAATNTATISLLLHTLRRPLPATTPR